MPTLLRDWALNMLKRSLSVKLVCFFLAVVLFTLTFCACGSTKNAKTQGETVVFTDALGRKVEVAKKPQRVAALLGSFADVWLLSGGDVCATAEDAWDDFGLDLPNAKNIGGAHSPNLELLLSANPQFILASASTASNVQMKETLEKANITVAYFDVDCFEDYLEMLKICTEITNRDDLYQKNGLEIKNQIDAVKSEVIKAEIPEQNRRILLLRASSGFVKAKGSKGTVLGEMLNDLGLINIADRDNTLLENLSVEQVIKNQPYRIFAVTMGDDTEKAVENLKRLITDNPAWSSLEAVNQGRVHVMDRKYFNLKPNAKWAESYEKLGNILLEK